MRPSPMRPALARMSASTRRPTTPAAARTHAHADVGRSVRPATTTHGRRDDGRDAPTRASPARSRMRARPATAPTRMTEVLPGLRAAARAETPLAVHALARGANVATMVSGPRVATTTRTSSATATHGIGLGDHVASAGPAPSASGRLARLDEVPLAVPGAPLGCP